MLVDGLQVSAARPAAAGNRPCRASACSSATRPALRRVVRAGPHRIRSVRRARAAEPAGARAALPAGVRAADAGRPGRRGRRSGRRYLGGRHRPRPHRGVLPVRAPVATFGKNLDQPAGIATDATGHVWVADTGHDRVVEFSPVGRVLAVFGSPGSGRGQLDQPVALAVTPFGDVWVADQGNSRVEEFSASGRYRASFAVPTRPASGWTSAATSGCPAPAYAPGNSVREFSPAGHQLRSFGTTQAGYGDLATPAASRSARAGGSTSRSRTTAWCRCSARPGASTPSSACSRAPAQADEDLEFPQGLAVTATGQIWVADSGHNRVVQFGRVPGHPGDRRAGRSRRPVAAADHRRVPAGPDHRRPRLVPGPAQAQGRPRARRRRRKASRPSPADQPPSPGAGLLPARTHPPPPAHHRHRAVRGGGGRGGAAGQPAQGAGRHARGPARRLAPRHRAHRHPDAGEPQLRPLLRHDAGGARLLRPGRDQAAGRQPGVPPAAPGPRPGLPDPVPPTTPRPPARRPRRAPITPGRPSTRPGTTARWTSGCRPRARSRWGTSPRRTSRSSGRWPRPSRSATTTTARCSARPTRTGCTCGPG